MAFILLECLSDGELTNIGHPYELARDSSTILYKMMKKLNKDEARNLMEIAKKHAMASDQLRSYLTDF
jgi:hypothetical protein